MDLIIPLIAAVVEFAPWIYVGRIQFLYQYALVTPMLVIAIVLMAASTRRRRIGQTAVAILIVAALVGFLLLLPMMSGLRVSAHYFATVRHVLPWVFNPPRPPLVG
jgi:dolichyl-phosphate-mannose--protein O-mannosyl transferase